MVTKGIKAADILGHRGSDYRDVKFTVKTKKVKALDVKR